MGDFADHQAYGEGFGLDGADEAGNLLELPLKIVGNNECYDRFVNYFKDDTTNLQKKISAALYDGISDQVLCTVSTCEFNELLIGDTENQGIEGELLKIG